MMANGSLDGTGVGASNPKLTISHAERRNLVYKLFLLEQNVCPSVAWPKCNLIFSLTF